MSSDEECDKIQCLMCKKELNEKPWISVCVHNNEAVHGCSYVCANQFRELLGFNYWPGVINKEDFNEPRPIYGYTNRISKKDITTGFGMDEIRDEIEEENRRIELIEEDYENDSSSEYSDEDIYQ